MALGEPQRSADDICRAMSRVRSEAREDAAEVHQSMGRLLDWRYYVERHPWACAGLAAAAGALIAPRGAKRLAVDAASLVRELKAQGVEAMRPGDEKTSPGVVHALMGLAMPLVFRAGMAAATSYVQHRYAAGDAGHAPATDASLETEPDGAEIKRRSSIGRRDAEN